ncbi:MAG: tRNA (guanosine(37)-N1)-methyltransferase TrmD [Myxococcota bacterium]
MRIAVVTLFPELFAPFAKTSFVGRAISSSILSLHLENLRPFGLGKHLSVDDTPYGGGSGMVMRPDCVLAGIEAAERAIGSDVPVRRALLTPQGARFDQAAARRLASYESLVLTCGRYEGFDERVRYFVDEEISIGDFVLTGGEVAAMCVIEAVVRLLPGVLGNSESVSEESFSPVCGGLLEYPQYTRPASFRGHEVPKILVSGDHAKIAEWRQEQSRSRTRERRPDLVSDVETSSDPARRPK